MEELLSELPYSAKNMANVKSILKKMANVMGIKMFLKKDFKNIDKLKEHIKEAMKPSKYTEAIQIMYQVAKILGVSKKHLENMENLRDAFRETRLLDYKSNAKYIPDNFEGIRKQLESFFNDDNILIRRLAKFYHAFGGIRQGEIRQTKVHTSRTHPRDIDFNYFMVKDKEWLIYNHKNAHRSKKQRTLKLPELILNELDTSENGVFYLTGTDKPANASKITRIFKTMTGITMKDLRHMEAEHYKGSSTEKQKEVSDKNGHSLSTMRLIYSNAFTNGDINETMVEDAKKHYERLLKKLEEQQTTSL